MITLLTIWLLLIHTFHSCLSHLFRLILYVGSFDLSPQPFHYYLASDDEINRAHCDVHAATCHVGFVFSAGRDALTPVARCKNMTKVKVCASAL